MEVINIGVIPGDQNADNLREGFDKINKNFKEVGLQKWTAKIYYERMAVVKDGDTYILSDTATLPYNSIDFNVELGSGVWISLSSRVNMAEIDPTKKEFVHNKNRVLPVLTTRNLQLSDDDAI
ncbi:MAG TPA: hypothetical protein EYG85_04480, partial [Crocinitomix sp.]|nr:hypothetical protein [Crocinitomix sp.]